MSQQDLLDTLFLNRKALADVQGSTQTAAATQPKMTTTTSATNATLPTSNMAATNGADAADKCPVDHKSREAWLAQARAAQEAQATAAATAASSSSQSQPPSQAQQIQTHPTQEPKAPQSAQNATSGWGWRIPFFSSSSSPSVTQSAAQQQTAPHGALEHKAGLGTDREISTIPRSTAAGATSAACPVNHETETGADPSTGNWVYPSEKMFFDAMKRKGHDTRAADMKTVVPIHNAVNERAWVEIKQWEKPYEASSCPGGPRLYSFTGLSNKMSPKARFNTLLGYTAPFDRHDWVIDRCGTQIEYVIDFYAGKNDKAGRPSFYLDVRPKLNSWEGVKMRASRVFGMV